jgi:hypothetical protein
MLVDYISRLSENVLRMSAVQREIFARYCVVQMLNTSTFLLRGGGAETSITSRFRADICEELAHVATA